MEGYVYIPHLLYVLRMNAEGTDAVKSRSSGDLLTLQVGVL